MINKKADEKQLLNIDIEACFKKHLKNIKNRFMVNGCECVVNGNLYSIDFKHQNKESGWFFK